MEAGAGDPHHDANGSGDAFRIRFGKAASTRHGDRAELSPLSSLQLWPAHYLPDAAAVWGRVSGAGQAVSGVTCPSLTGAESTN